MIIGLCFVSVHGYIIGQGVWDYAVQLTTSVTEEPPAISFQWKPIQGDSAISVYRKSPEATAWGDAIATLPSTATEFTDNNVDIGIVYEYKITKYDTAENVGIFPIVTYVNAGIKCRETEYRGKVILLVDSSFVDSLRSELARLENDLTGDGWEILRKDISRNATVKYVKGIIRDFYKSDTVNVKTVLLFGHIPVPYSGFIAWDGHPGNHNGAWPADMYYGAMDEKNWTDTGSCITVDERNLNIAGDGKFDVDLMPPGEIISLAIGRVDLYNLPAFPLSEAELLRNYLAKNHSFRHKLIDPKFQSLVDDNFYSQNKYLDGAGPWRNHTALLNAPNVKAGDYVTDMKVDSYIWSSGNSGGGWDVCSNVVSTKDFVNECLKTVFTGLDGSYFPDWDSQNNLIRSALASKSWILSCFTFEGVPYYYYHPMGMGETLGYGLLKTQNNVNTYEQYDLWWIDWNGTLTSLSGDPTLRMHIVSPVSSLQSAITANECVMLAWKPAGESVIGYHVYRLDSLTNKYNRITASPVAETWFEDTLPSAGNNYYMVKSYKLSEVASGSYYNLSQGIFDTINYGQQTPVPVSDIALSVSPQNILPLKFDDPFIIDVVVTPENATNKLLKWSIENLTCKGKFNANGQVIADKGGNLAIVAEALDGSNISARLEISIDSVPDAAGSIAGEPEICRDRKPRIYTTPAIRGATSYIWKLPDGVTDTTFFNEIRYFAEKEAPSGYISVKGLNKYADGPESKKYITLYDMPPKPVIKQIGNTLYSSAGSGNQWYMDDNTLIEGATDSVFTPLQTGNYHVIVTLNNCPSYKSNVIAFVPTFINFNEQISETILFPNPSDGRFTLFISATPIQQALLQVYNLHGKMVFAENYQHIKTAAVDLSALPKGIYIVKVITDEKNYFGKVCLE